MPSPLWLPGTTLTFQKVRGLSVTSVLPSPLHSTGFFRSQTSLRLDVSLFFTSKVLCLAVVSLPTLPLISASRTSSSAKLSSCIFVIKIREYPDAKGNDKHHAEYNDCRIDISLPLFVPHDFIDPLHFFSFLRFYQNSVPMDFMIS